METPEKKEEMTYNSSPNQVSRQDFNRYILAHLKTRHKGPNRNCLSTRFSTIFCMSCIRVFNGNNCEPSAMNYIGPMSTSGIIGGQKMAHINNCLKPRLFTSKTPHNLTPRCCTAMEVIPLLKKDALQLDIRGINIKKETKKSPLLTIMDSQSPF